MLKSKRVRRHKKIRRIVSGTANRPRVSVYRSGAHIYAQVIDDVKKVTLFAGSDLGVGTGTKKERALQLGENLAKQVTSKKITEIIFDRGGFKYHGRIASVAEGLRKGGLKF